MALEEVAVDLVPETDFGEISAEETSDLPPKEEKTEPEKGTPTDTPEGAEKVPPEKEAEPSKGAADPVEKLKKDVASLGYNLRELNRQKAFVEEQLRQERAKNQKKEIKEGYALELQKIDHLKEIDPAAYIQEYTRIMESRVNKEVETERESVKTNETIAQAQARRQRTEEQLIRDFPDIANQGSELFMESQKALMSRYSAEDVAFLLNSNPQVFYGIVKETSLNLKIKKLEAQQAEKSREARVQTQGVVKETKKSAPSGPVLSKEQIKFCKENNFDLKEYARFIGKGR